MNALAGRILTLTLKATLVSVPSMFVASSYFQVDWPGQLIYKGTDQWCDPATQGVGIHCFGDFSDIYSRDFFSPWTSVAAPVAHPPFSLLIQSAFAAVGVITGIRQVGILLWLTVLGAAVLSPAIWASRHLPSPSKWLALLVLGTAATPTLSLLDRGNSAGLAVLPLLWFAISMLRGHPRQADIAVVVGSLLRPQLIVLALVYLFRQELFRTIRVVLLSVVALLASFLVYPGDRIANLTHWFHNLFGHSGYQSIFDPYPQSLSIMRSLALAAETLWIWLLQKPAQMSDSVFNRSDAPVSTLRDAINAHATVLSVFGILIVAALTMLVWRRGRRLTSLSLIVLACVGPAIGPRLSFSYYSVFLLVPAAVALVADDQEARFTVAGPAWLETASRKLFIASVVVTVVPVIVPLSVLIPLQSYSRANLFVSLTGPMWLLMVLLLLIALLVPESRFLSNPIEVGEGNPTSEIALAVLHDPAVISVVAFTTDPDARPQST